MDTIQQRRLVNFNRTLILTLTLIGLLMDGYQGSDLPCAFALILWLWMPYCTRIEAKLLKHINTTHNHIVRPDQHSILNVGQQQTLHHQ